MQSTIQSFLRYLMLLLFVCLAGCRNDPPREEVRADASVTGETLYIRYCADCHGWRAEGDGPAADMLEHAPPSLRQQAIVAEASLPQFRERVWSGRPLAMNEEAASRPDSAQEVSELVRYIKRLPSIRWDSVDAGQQKYDELCIGCHGLYGRGDGAIASSLSVSPADLNDPEWKQRYDRQGLVELITQGKAPMPGTQGILNDAEREQIIAFVDMISPGFETYERYCVVCHGVDGVPVEPAYPDESMYEYELESVPAFDKTYFSTHSDEYLRSRVVHMLDSARIRMPHFSGILGEEQIARIQAYLRGLGTEAGE